MNNASSKINWYKIAQHQHQLIFNTNNLLEVAVEGKKICVAKYNEKLTAFAATCPHAGAAFVNGYIDALGYIVCPLHFYKFNVLLGKNCTNEGYFLKKYAIESRQDGVFIGFQENNTNF